MGISVLMVIIILLFNNAAREIISSSCIGEHALSCPMYNTVNRQTYLALGIVGLLVIIGFVIMFTKPQEKIVVKRLPKFKKKIDTSDLRPEDKKIFHLVQSQGAIFQADLIEKTGFGKAKMSRIIDRLEGRGIVERKRRGMTNVVVLKDVDATLKN